MFLKMYPSRRARCSWLIQNCPDVKSSAVRKFHFPNKTFGMPIITRCDFKPASHLCMRCCASCPEGILRIESVQRSQHTCVLKRSRAQAHGELHLVSRNDYRLEMIKPGNLSRKRVYNPAEDLSPKSYQVQLQPIKR